MSDIEFREHSSVKLIRAQADDQMIAEDARLSTRQSGSAAAAEDFVRNEGLVRALMRERHGTPFEAPQFTFEIEAPIFVAREAHRHRIASISEMSGRYVELQPIFWVPSPTRPLIQKPGSKQMQYELERGSDEQYSAMLSGMKAINSAAWLTYQKLLEDGVVKEVARTVLPVSIFTRWRLRINLRSALNFLSLRTRDERAAYPSKPQIEITEIAKGMERIMEQHCPIAMDAFNQGGRVAP